MPGQLYRLLVSVAVLAANAGGVAADCTLTATGKTPLNDLGVGLYLGFPGGLYPGGVSARPPAHEAAGLVAAAAVLPRTPTGAVDMVTGRIVLISVGMSNTSQEFGSPGVGLKARADADPSKNPRLVIVDCAQGGQTALQWQNPADPAWQTCDSRLAVAGVTAQQVQAAWVKLADRTADMPERTFPAHAEWHRDNLVDVYRNLRARYPNVRLAFLSGRTRAYTDVIGSLNPEPISYEASFAVRWAIEAQLQGAADLNFDPTSGPVVAPHLSWGPYLWTDGVVPRSDGLVWLCSDLQPDFVHPSVSGVQKVASQLLAFFKTDPLTRPWFLRSASTGAPPGLTIEAYPRCNGADFTVDFDAAASDSDGTVVGYAWSFSDGGSSLAQSPTKVFPATGIHRVHATVSDDDGNATTRSVEVDAGVCEACTGENGAPALDRGRVILRAIGADPVAGDDSMLVSGRFVLPAGSSWDTLDPIADGVRLRIEAQDGTAALDVTVPGGAFDGRFGWAASRSRFTFRDRARPPRFNGISLIRLRDRGARLPNQLEVVVMGKQGSYPVVAGDEPLTVTVVVGDAGSGECATKAFAPGQCALDASATRLACLS